MTTRIYVNRKAIEQNAHEGTEKPCVTVDRDGVREECGGADIRGPSTVVYSPHRTVDGAHVWIETEADVITTREP